MPRRAAGIPTGLLQSITAFARTGLLVLFSSTLGNAASYVLYVVGSRHLSQAQYGDFYALITASALVGVLAQSAMAIVARTTAAYLSGGDVPRLVGFVSWARNYSAATGIVLILMVSMSSGALTRFLHLQAPLEIVAWSFVTAASIAAPAYRGALQGVQDFRALSISVGTEGLLRAGLSIVAILFGYEVVGALWGQFAGLIVAMFYGALVFHRSFQASPRERFSPSSHLLAGIAGATTATLGTTLLASSDILLVKHFLTPKEAGIYSVVALCGRIIFFMGTFVPTILTPTIAARAARQEATLPLLGQGAIISIVTSLAGITVFAVAGRNVVQILAGPAFAQAAAYVVTYAVAMLFLNLATVLIAYQIAIHRFAFIAPLLSVAAAEAIALAIFHRDIGQVVAIVLAVEACAVLAACWGLTRKPRTAPAP